MNDPEQEPIDPKEWQRVCEWLAKKREEIDVFEIKSRDVNLMVSG